MSTILPPSHNPNLPSPTPSPAPGVAPLRPDQVICLAIQYLLYERARSTDLTAAFIVLLQERHENFHVKPYLGRPGHTPTDPGAPPADFRQCDNDKCKLAASVLLAAQSPEVEISPLTVELMRDYKFNINPVHGPGGFTYFVKLLEPGAIDPVMLRIQQENISRVKATMKQGNPTERNNPGPKLIIP
jgi:hypothetical protein